MEKQVKTKEKAKKKRRFDFVTIQNIWEEVRVFVFHFRKVILAIPVILVAIRLARINWELLPEEIGLSLMANGQLAQIVSREAAVYGPMAITGVCLALMFCSRRALYPWLISVFTLVVPIVLLFINVFPS